MKERFTFEDKTIPLESLDNVLHTKIIQNLKNMNIVKLFPGKKDYKIYVTIQCKQK